MSDRHDHAGDNHSSDDHAGHSHGLGQLSSARKHRGKLQIALIITLTVMVIEVVGALLSGSLSLLADAGHMLTDALGVALALVATWMATKPATKGRTFGWQRMEILAAMINGLVIGYVGISAIIAGIGRVSNPGEVEAPIMMITAAIGLVANGISLRLLHGGQGESLNVRGAYLEVLGDLLGSIAVIIAAVIIQFTGFAAADGLASIAIGLMIVPRAYSLLKDVALVLLEATPKDIDLAEIRQHMQEIPEVRGVHDLHAWTITSGVPVMSAHIEVGVDCLDEQTYTRVLSELRVCVAEHFDVEHSTIQIEPPSHRETENAAHD